MEAREAAVDAANEAVVCGQACMDTHARMHHCILKLKHILDTDERYNVPQVNHHHSNHNNNPNNNDDKTQIV